MAIDTKTEMKIPSQVEAPRSRRRKAGDLVVSLAMIAVLIALYVLVVSRGHLPL